MFQGSQLQSRGPTLLDGWLTIGLIGGSPLKGIMVDRNIVACVPSELLQKTTVIGYMIGSSGHGHTSAAFYLSSYLASRSSNVTAIEFGGIRMRDRVPVKEQQSRISAIWMNWRLSGANLVYSYSWRRRTLAL